MLDELKLGGLARAVANLAEFRRIKDLDLNYELLEQPLDALLAECERLGLDTTAQSITDSHCVIVQRILAQREGKDHGVHFSLYEELNYIIRTLTTEASRKKFLYVKPDRANLYIQEPADFVGAPLPVCISRACWDNVREALRCFAVESPTATVFHCCRALEAVLVEVVWPSVGSPALDNPAKPTWGDYLKAIAGVLAPQQKARTRTEDWDNEKVSFYEALISDYSKVKDAERADVSHTHEMFSDTRARSLLGHTAALLEVAARHFADDGEYKPS